MSRLKLITTAWVACAAGIAGPAAAPGLADPPGKRAGKVVRVERTRQVDRTELRFCFSPALKTPTITCMGGAPGAGVMGALLDFSHGYLGNIRVNGVTPGQSDGFCNTGSMFDVGFDFVDGQLDMGPLSYTIAVFGVALDRTRARLVMEPEERPGQNPQAHPWLGLDKNGDNASDYILMVLDCRDEVPPHLKRADMETLCLDYWEKGPRGWHEVRRDYLYSCR